MQNNDGVRAARSPGEPEPVAAAVDPDPVYGNLLTLPVGEGGLLYVEPVYIERTGQSTSFPQLARVLVSYNGQVGYAPTLAGALDQVFGSGAGSSSGRADTEPPPGSRG